MQRRKLRKSLKSLKQNLRQIIKRDIETIKRKKQYQNLPFKDVEFRDVYINFKFPRFSRKNESEKNKIINDIFEKFDLSVTKEKRHWNLKSSITKMEQAKELIQELKIKDNKTAKQIIFIF